MKTTRIIVIGASSGGVTALRELVARLPRGLPAPVLIVQHIGALPSMLPSILAAAGPLEATHAVDGQMMTPGRVYVAPPDHHMLVDGPLLRVARGPKEHHSRPAIDPLFRSAALSRGVDVIGVVLTGMLDDGTAGLQVVKACGGIAVVQDPADAESPDMPLSALKHVEVDHCLPLADIAGLLARLAATRPGAVAPTPLRAGPIADEHDLSLSKGEPMDHLKAIGTPSTFVCPDCKGSLWQVAGAQPQRYRCHTGHAYTLRSLEHAQAQATDEALWGAIRALQEKYLLLGTMAAASRAEGDEAGALRLEADARDVERQAAVLRQIAEKVPGPIAA
jgi:two-component system chemotaxis response regulator CheB